MNIFVNEFFTKFKKDILDKTKQILEEISITKTLPTFMIDVCYNRYSEPNVFVP